jgi:NADH-quinone oxidoreductase subunit G
MAEALIHLTVDGKPVAVPKGTNVIEAAKQARVEIPHYCYHRRLSVAGNCRMCLVEIGLPKAAPAATGDAKPAVQFLPKLQIACNTPVSEGMVVVTDSPKVVKARQGVMEFLLINHPLDCPICDQAGECRLQEFAVDYGKGPAVSSRPRSTSASACRWVPRSSSITSDASCARAASGSCARSPSRTASASPAAAATSS